MIVVTRDMPGDNRSIETTIVPIGDIHIGAAACDEALLRKVVQRVADDPNCYWVGMGDMCDFVNLRDPRFDSRVLAPWVGVEHMHDLPRAQVRRFLDIVQPIASKCLALLCGNHEDDLCRHYERDVYGEVVTGLKELAGWPADYQLGLGFYGWLILRWRRGVSARLKGSNVSTVRLNMHHGFTGGRLAGAQALSLERWLWTHEADVVLFGHAHRVVSEPVSVERVNQSGHVEYQTRRGAVCGSFLKTVNEGGSSTYAERRGYLPLPVGGVEIRIRPFATPARERVAIIH